MHKFGSLRVQDRGRVGGNLLFLIIFGRGDVKICVGSFCYFESFLFVLSFLFIAFYRILLVSSLYFVSIPLISSFLLIPSYHLFAFYHSFLRFPLLLFFLSLYLSILSARCILSVFFTNSCAFSASFLLSAVCPVFVSFSFVTSVLHHF